MVELEQKGKIEMLTKRPAIRDTKEGQSDMDSLIYCNVKFNS